MSLIGSIAKFFGLISVHERKNKVYVSGVDGMVLQTIIATIWQTNVFNKQMFTSVTKQGFVFHRFFVPDVVFMLSKIALDPKCSWGIKNSAEKIITGLIHNTWYKCSVAEYTSMIDLKRLKKIKWKPMPKQLEFLHLYGELMPKYDLRGYIVGFAPGGGKAQPLDALIRTPNGFEPMGSMQVGKMLVMPDGSTAPVTGVYPQGVKDIYRITFSDGRSTECCEEHLWKIHHRNWNRTPEPWRVIQLSEIRKLLLMKDFRKRMYVQLPEPEVRPDQELPLDPYVLGALIGDGGLSSNGVMFSTSDDFLVSEINRLLPENTELLQKSKYDYTVTRKDRASINNRWDRNPVITALRDLDLFGTKSNNKFIPVAYMQGSVEQRYALLQGLMDTDGTVSENRSLSFCTVSVALAHQVQRLVRGLGGLCKISVRYPYYTYNGERRAGQLAYQLNIRLKEPKRAFRLPRQLARLTDNYQYADRLRLRIERIELVGRKEAQCLSVGHPDHLYITDDDIVTHNTLSDLFLATCVIPPSIAEVKIIISPKKAVHLVWEDTVRKVFVKPPPIWCSDSPTEMPLKNTEYYIFNFEALDKAIKLADSLKTRNVRYFVIVDESHNFADYKSARTQKLVKLQTMAKNTYFIWTSGTPVLKHGAELVSFLKCADPRFDDEAEKIFRKIWTAAPGRANEIFNHRLGKMMAFMVPKSEFTKIKPKVVELPVKLPPQLAKKFLMSSVREEMKAFIAQRVEFYAGEMDSLRKTVNTWFEYHTKKLTTSAEKKAWDQYLKYLKLMTRNPDITIVEARSYCQRYERSKLLPSLPPRSRREFRHALSAFKNLKLKVRGEALGTVLSKRRSDCAAALGIFCRPEEIMKNSLSKTLFFSSGVRPVRIMFKYLEDKGFKPLLVYGGTNSQLTAMMHQFERDPLTNPVCATMQSLSEAVPVIAASTVVLLNRPFRQAQFDQIVSRADRIGQIHPVTVIEVTLDTGGEPNVSSTTDDILAEVRLAINAIVGADYAGPDPDEREYQPLIDASSRDSNHLKILDDF